MPVRKGMADWLQRRTKATGDRVVSSPSSYPGQTGIVPTWLTQYAGGAPVQEPPPTRTGTATATNQPTSQELNAAYLREREQDRLREEQRVAMLGSYGIEAAPVGDQRLQIPDWLSDKLPEGFSEGMFEAATAAPITFTGGGPVVGQVQLPKLEGGPEYLQTRGGQEVPEEPYTIEQWLADYKAGLIDDGLELQKQKERRSVISRQLRYLALQKPPGTTDVGDYDDSGGGGSDWWSPSYSGGGGSYTPAKAASRWWMNLSKWNI